MPQTLTAVVYDTHTLAPRRVIFPHDDSHLSSGVHHLQAGEAMAIIPNSFITGISTTDAAMLAIAHKTGRHPPSMDLVHAHDKISRGMNGGKLRIY
jgi:hypothetical protein